MVQKLTTMGKKREIARGLAGNISLLLNRPAMPPEDITALGNKMPVLWMTNPKLVNQYISDNGLNLVDGSHFADWVLSLQEILGKVDVDSERVTFADLNEGFEKAKSLFIIIHRVNYVLHQAMVRVYDLLEREGRLRFAIKKCQSQTEALWESYVRPRRLDTERTAWFVLQDHMDLAYDAVEPKMEKVYEALRDYMIYLRWRDVELKARCCVALLMGEVAGASYEHFFDDFRKELGIDFSRCFAADDLQPMVKRFAMLCDALGIKTCKDQYGYYALEGFAPSKNLRFKQAWLKFMDDLRDDDIIDNAAREALDLNPKSKALYEHVLEESEREQEAKKQREMEEGFKKLEEKYKVIQTDKAI